MTPLQKYRIGHLAHDVTTGRWYVYAHSIHGYGWVRVLRFKSPLWQGRLS